MLKKVISILIYLIFIIGIIVFIIGFIKVKKINDVIETGVEEVERIFDEAEKNDIDLNTIIENQSENSSTKDAIGLITFKLNKVYKVAVYNNITEETLKKGAGRATGSSKLNEKGNCVLYAHRDSGFRALWDIKVGDVLEVKTFKNTKEYVVSNIYITTPEDEKIFNQTEETKLTLVTCYPFVYSGSANERCIVECVVK